MKELYSRNKISSKN